MSLCVACVIEQKGFAMLVANIERNVAFRKSQSGIMLLEVLIAILIFALGILALVALQTTSVRLTADAQYRGTASLLTNKLISEMRINRLSLSPTELQNEYQSDPAGESYSAWLSDDVEKMLAGVFDPNTPPEVSVVTTGANEGLVTVTIQWRTAPNADSFHQLVTTTQIR